MAQQLNPDQVTTVEEVGILHFTVPTTGQVLSGVATHEVNYNDIQLGTNSTITRSGSRLVIGTSGFYTVTANIRMIDAKQPMVHQVQASPDNSTWYNLSYWQPENHVNPANTGRQLSTHSMTVYLPAGTYLRHLADITAQPTRIGGSNDDFGKYNTSLSVARAVS